jgi:acetylglutamate kinase
MASIDEIEALIASGVINGGMIPKVKGCIESVKSGVQRTHILNGTIPIRFCLRYSRTKALAQW